MSPTYIDLLSKLTHFASNQLQGVAVQGNKPQVCQEAGVGRRKSQYIRKVIYQRISCLYDNLENTGQLVSAMRERANQRSGKECCCCFSYQFSLQGRGGRPFATEYLHNCNHVSIPAPSLFIFMGLKRLKNKITKIEENLTEL